VGPVVIEVRHVSFASVLLLAYVIRPKAKRSIGLDPRSAYRSDGKRPLRTVGTPVPVAL